MNSNIQCISEHSVDLSLINRSSNVLDLGCRAFGWAKAMLEYVDTVHCVDADNDVYSTDERLPVLNVAVSNNDDQTVQFIKYGNGTGNHIHRGTNPKPARCREQVTKTMTLPTVLDNLFGVQFIDLIKFDIEGEEVPVILSLVQAPTKQLSIEWHFHTGTNAIDIRRCYFHLVKLGYECVLEDQSEKHGAGFNIWDSLFILK